MPSLLHPAMHGPRGSWPGTESTSPPHSSSSSSNLQSPSPDHWPAEADGPPLAWLSTGFDPACRNGLPERAPDRLPLIRFREWGRASPGVWYRRARIEVHGYIAYTLCTMPLLPWSLFLTTASSRQTRQCMLYRAGIRPSRHRILEQTGRSLIKRPHTTSSSECEPIEPPRPVNDQPRV